MIELTGNRGSPKHWTLCFDRTATAWTRFVPGRYKHVRAFGYVPLDAVWLFVDWNICGLTLRAAPDGSQTAAALIRTWIDRCDLVQVEAGARQRVPPGLYCVGAIKRLTGIPSGALLPDGLWRDCLKFGGRTFDEFQRANAAVPATAPS